MVHLNRNGKLAEKPRLLSSSPATKQAANPLPRLADDMRRQLERLTTAEEHERAELAVVDEVRRLSAALIETLLTVAEKVSSVEEKLAEVHAVIANQKPKKDWYTVKEVAESLGKAEFTVREWCRLGRVHAAKRDCGRGNSQEWIVSDKELIRIQNEGLLPE